MTREEAIKMMKAKLECMTREVSGLSENCNKKCDECNLCYDQGNMGEQIEWMKIAIKALEQEPSVEILKTEESNDNGTKYLNINVSDGEVKRNPDIVRLCSDVGVLEYVKPKTGHWDNVSICGYRCSECGKIQYADDVNELNYCCTCGARMESEDKE